MYARVHFGRSASELPFCNHCWWVLSGVRRLTAPDTHPPHSWQLGVGARVWANPMLPLGTLTLEGELRDCSRDSTSQSLSCEDSRVARI